jgi:CheY-like chemotaxis protein
MIIFLLEDDPDDQKLFEEALAEINSNIILTIAENGEEALNMLNRSLLEPDLIFADINVPLMNGIEFLRNIRQTPHLKDIPAIMLSTSRREEHSRETDSLGAQFFTKPSGFRELCSIIEKGINLVSSNGASH